MKAIIMAGGEGSRLRPLTCDCPKPMVPVMDRPVMEYSLELLKQHGIAEVGVTLMYLPGRIMDTFGDGSDYGVSLEYYTETTPLGTAGSVRQAIDFLTETFVVLSGDGLTDCNLSAAYRFHKSRGALATLVLKRVETPLEYGVVITGADGRVKRFVEKPGWGEVFSDMVNTGIYLLEPEALSLIPDNRPYDFGRELFPKMVERDMPVFGYPMDGYWCDIGDTGAYLKAHADIMDGRVKICPFRPGGVVRMPGAIVDKGAVIEGPCYIGADARVEEGARIGPYSVLGAGSIVMRGAGVKRSVLWRGARVLQNGQARGSVIQNGARIGEDAQTFEESVLGDSAVLGARCMLMPGVRVWPHKLIDDGEKIDANIVWGAQYSQRFLGGKLPLHSPAQAVRDAQAYADALRPGEVLIARDASAVAMAYSRAAVAGLMAQGALVVDMGAASLPQMRSVLYSMNMSSALYISSDGMLPLSDNGALLSRNEQRKLTGALIRQDHAGPFSGITRPPVLTGRTDLIYIGMLLNAIDTALIAKRPPKLAVYAQYEQILSLAERMMTRAGCAVRAEWEEELMELAPGEIGLWFSETGETVTFADERGTLSEAESQMLAAWTLLEGGTRKLILPTGATRGIEQIASAYGAQVERVKSDRPEWMRALLFEDHTQFMVYLDGIFFAMKALERLNAAGLTLREWTSQLPSVHRRQRVVQVDLKDKGQIMRVMAESMPDADLTDGVRVSKQNGWSWISPGGDRGECLIMSESSDAEFASEMCDFYATEVEKILARRAGERSSEA